jgi:hypothetical protein
VVGALVGLEARSTATPLQQKNHVAREVWSMPVNASLADSLSFDRRAQVSWQFTVGLRVKGKADRIVVYAEDALIAALKVKAERPTATVMYVRRLNRRGDTRHPPHTLTETPQ